MSTEQSYPALISLAAHELRTPANVVGGYLRMLQREVDPPLADRQRKMLDEAEKSFARLVTLINQLGDIARLDGGLVTLNRQQIDLFVLARDVAVGLHEAEERAVLFEVRGVDSGALMTGDLDRLRTALGAIFRAIVHETAGPCTLVADRRLVGDGSATSALIVVAEEASVQTAYDSRPAVFDDKRGGLGLALPMARRIVEAHGGRLWAPAEGDRAARGAALMAFPIPGLNR